MDKFWIGLYFVFLTFTQAAAQHDSTLFTKLVSRYDTSYYNSYETQLTARFYFSKKYTAFRFYDKEDDVLLKYFPNTNLNMGVGATYKWATLNLAYGFGFLNPTDNKGKTEYLDLQCHIYGRRFLIDLLGQFYSGFFLRNQDLRDANGNYYIRPDIKVYQMGASAQYMTNYRKFSYRAGFLQNEWQKKSAGTMLLGWQLIWGRGLADSTIVPTAISQIPSDPQHQQLTFVETGPSIGYAYTLVIKKHFFIMGSATMIISFGSSVIEGAESVRSSSFIPNFSFKTFAGWNSKHWAISLTFTNEMVNISADENNQTFSLNTGNLRLNFVRRFKIKDIDIDVL